MQNELKTLHLRPAGCLQPGSVQTPFLPPYPTFLDPQIQKLGLTTPMASYKYAAFTIVTSVSLGLLVYGVPAWTY